MKTFTIQLLTGACALSLAITTLAQSAPDTDESPAPQTGDEMQAGQMESGRELTPGTGSDESSVDLEPMPEDVIPPRAEEFDGVMPERGVFAPDQRDMPSAEFFTPSESSNDAPSASVPTKQPSRNPFSQRGESQPSNSRQESSRITFGADDKLPASDEESLRLNFRGVPLERVLDYLSEAAGFIIIPETDIKGRVDVWSNQPLTRDEAVDVLNSVLNKNGYAAIRNGRTLTIVNRAEAQRRNIPVIPGANPQDIPKTDEIVTQIIPVRYINAAALTRDLQPLLPADTTLTANEAGNSLILTDTQANIRRMAEIVAALDTSVASISTVRVFPLRYADAKELATIVKEVFETPSTTDNQNGRNRFQNFFRGPGGRGGDGGADTTANNSGRAGASRVTAVSDERSNSLVVSAPAELIPTIEELVHSVDTNVEDITELRVFHLQFADPVETADMLTSLFQDQDDANNNSRRVRFGGRRGFNPFGNNNASSEQSDRMKKQSRVVAVADQRTGSVVVSAAHELMDQIGAMIEQLDADPAHKKKVFVYSVENTDPQAVQEILQNLFETQNTRNRNNTRQNTAAGNQLNNRATQIQNQGNRNNTGLGGNSFGNSSVAGR